MSGNFLEALIYGVRRVLVGGAEMPLRSSVNFIGASAVDNPATGATDVTITGGNAITADVVTWRPTNSPHEWMDSFAFERTTIDSTVTVGFERDVDAGAVERWDAVAIATDVTGEVASWALSAVFKRVGGAAVLVGSQVAAPIGTAIAIAWDGPFFTVSTTKAQLNLQATEDVGTVKWSLVGHIVRRITT